MTLARRPIAALLVLSSLALGGGAALLAQDEGELKPEDLFASSKGAYGEKKYGKCLADLNLLVGAVSKLRIEQIKPCLPAAPAGWKAEDPTGESIGAGFMMGAGLTVKREYTKPAPEGSEEGEPRVTAELTVNSPLIGMIASMLTNPMLLQGQEGSSVIKVKGKNALIEFRKGSKSGSLKLLLQDNTTLLTLSGDGIQRSDLADLFAKAIDVEKLEKVLAE